MGFGVFIHRQDSVYDDSPAERYQFPKQYLNRAQRCVGDWVIYNEPTKVARTCGYFAVAKVQQTIPDPSATIFANTSRRMRAWINSTCSDEPPIGGA